MPSPGSLYSAWPIIGGALSRAIGESFQGLTQGGIQGEEIRHKRAGEDLQNQYLQQALGQQALQERRLGSQEAFQHGTLLWRLQEAAERERRDRAMEAQRAADAERMGRRDEATERRWMDQSADNEGWRRKQELRWDEDRRLREEEKAADRKRLDKKADEDRSERAREANMRNSARLTQLGINAQRAEAQAKRTLTTSTALNQQQKLQLASLSMKARDLRQQVAIANQEAQLGRTPRHDPAQLEMELAKVVDEIEAMSTAAGGGPAAAPKALDAAGVAKKWGLQ
jgi:hypothetical protein